MGLIDIEALRRAPLKTEPYEYLVAHGFLSPKSLRRVDADFPAVPAAGSFTLDKLEIGGAFAALLDEMDGPEFRQAVEEKFGIDLAARPTMFTVRGFCRRGDGKIHTDTESKIITVLLYLNPGWEAEGGRLRILRSADDLEDAAEEIEPLGGTLLIFRRSDRSWHGHKPFAGPRRALQMNWVTDARYIEGQQRFHRLTAFAKRFLPGPSAASGDR